MYEPTEQYNTNDDMMYPNPSTDQQSNGVEILQLERREMTEKQEQGNIFFRCEYISRFHLVTNS